MTREEIIRKLTGCVDSIWGHQAMDEQLSPFVTMENMLYTERIEQMADLIIADVLSHKVHVDVHYCEEDDMTFLIESIYDGDLDDSILISQECVGWYYGEPTEENTRKYYRDLKADYNSEHYHRGKE